MYLMIQFHWLWDFPPTPADALSSLTSPLITVRYYFKKKYLALVFFDLSNIWKYSLPQDLANLSLSRMF